MSDSPPKQENLLRMGQQLKSRLDAIQHDGLALEIKVALKDCAELCTQMLKNIETLQSSSTTAAGSAPSTSSVPDPSKSIYVIDDDEDTQKILRFMLTRKGFKVISETDPLAAFVNIEKINPPLVLLDLMMPGCTGYEMLQKLKPYRTQNPNMKIIVGSSRSFDKDRLAVREAGADDFIAKPYNLDELVLMIRKYIG